jgi:hypothetical protein
LPPFPGCGLHQDGRSPFDIRNRYFLGGTIGLPHNFRLSPFMVVSSGTPFNITLSQDLIGTAQFNQRPALANGAVGPTIVTVPGIGSFNTVPAPSTLRKRKSSGSTIPAISHFSKSSRNSRMHWSSESCPSPIN